MIEMSENERYEKALKDSGFESFKVLSESWGIYALKDGSYLRLRANIIKIARQTDYDGNMAFNVNANMTVGFIPPRNLRGNPAPRPPTPQELSAAIVDSDVEFSTIEEEWSRYQLQDGIVISVKPIPVTIARTNIYDPNGEPIYNVNHQLLIKANIPEELRKKGIQAKTGTSGHPSFIT